MSHFRAFAATLFAVCLAAAALATPNIVGVTGLLATPTPDTPGAGGHDLFAYHLEGVSNYTYGFNYGIRDNMEIGFARLAGGRTILNVKYAFQPETAERPGLAIGLIDATDAVESTLYVVGSKSFPRVAQEGIDNFRVYGGVAGSGTVFLDNFFLGASIRIRERVTALIEHDGDNLNFGVSVPLTSTVTARAGVVGDDRSVVLGAAYSSTF